MSKTMKIKHKKVKKLEESNLRLPNVINKSSIMMYLKYMINKQPNHQILVMLNRKLMNISIDLDLNLNSQIYLNNFIFLYF